MCGSVVRVVMCKEKGGGYARFSELESTFNLHSEYEPPDTFARHIRGRHNSIYHPKSKNTFKYIKNTLQPLPDTFRTKYDPPDTFGKNYEAPDTFADTFGKQS